MIRQKFKSNTTQQNYNTMYKTSIQLIENTNIKSKERIHVFAVSTSNCKHDKCYTCLSIYIIVLAIGISSKQKCKLHIGVTRGFVKCLTII